MTTTARRPRAELSTEQLRAGREDMRKVCQLARRKANRIATDETANRSTRNRAALKVKADAFDQLDAMLFGKV